MGETSDPSDPHGVPAARRAEPIPAAGAVGDAGRSPQASAGRWSRRRCWGCWLGSMAPVARRAERVPAAAPVRGHTLPARPRCALWCTASQSIAGRTAPKMRSLSSNPGGRTRAARQRPRTHRPAPSIPGSNPSDPRIAPDAGLLPDDARQRASPAARVAGVAGAVPMVPPAAPTRRASRWGR